MPWILGPDLTCAGAGTSHKMPNGQNFFDVLKKQLANLDQNK